MLQYIHSFQDPAHEYSTFALRPLSQNNFARLPVYLNTCCSSLLAGALNGLQAERGPTAHCQRVSLV